jgi:hypothetical protein
VAFTGMIPAALWLCAACALRDNGPGRQLLSLSMILLPFMVVGVSIYAIRRMAKAEAEPLPASADSNED